MGSGSSSTLQGEPTAVGTDGPIGQVAAGSVLRRGDSVGRYLVLRQLGAGGMGEVYVAHDPDLDREVALKLVWGRDLDTELSLGERKRLLREAQSLARLSHPNVVVVHDAGEFQAGVFIAMEYVDGPTLRRWNKDRTRTWEEIRDVFVEAGRGLLAAHEAGIVHRDFKPDNVMIDGRGKVRVLDFGLAREDGSILSTGDIRQGTPGYVAPDQMVVTSADVRGDIFAFCVAFYEVLYGERPFQVDGADMLKSAISGKTQSMLLRTDVPRWLRRTLSKGLSPVDQRWSSMHEVLDALQQDRAQRRRRRTALGVIALVGAGLSGFALSKAGPDCESWARRVTPIWGPQSPGEFHSRVEQAGLEASDGVTTTTARVTEYAAALQEAMDAACRDSDGSDSALLALRRACLSEHRDRLAVTVDGLMDEPAWAVKNPDQALEQLVPLSRCEEADRRLAYREAVADPRVAELRRRVLTLENALNQGHSQSVDEDLQTLLADAETLGSNAALVEVRLVLGTAAFEKGDFTEAQRYCESALAVALQTTDRDLQFRPLSDLMFLHAQAGRSEAIRVLLPVGRAVLDDGEASLDGRRRQLENVEALAYMRAGELDKARSMFASLAESGEGIRVAGFLNNLGATQYMLGRHGEAEKTYRDALERYVVEYGPDNLRALEIRVNLADVLAAQGRFSEASALYDESLGSFQRIGVTASVELARAIHHRGSTRYRQGKLSAAVADIDKALGMLIPKVGLEHPYVLAAKHTKIDVLLVKGDIERARVIAEENREAYDALAASGSFKAVLEIQRGRIALLSGDLESAKVHFEAGLAAMKGTGGDATPQVECTAGLIEVDLRRGEIESAQQRLVAAKAVLAESASIDPGSAAALRTWMAAAMAAGGRIDDAQAAVEEAKQTTASNPGDPTVPAALQRRLLEDPQGAVEPWVSANDAGTAD